MSHKVTFALVGSGGMGRANANRVLNDGRGEIVAVCDTNIETARDEAKHLGVSAVFTTLEDLLSSRTAFDAAIVSTPNVTHAPISLALLEAGKNVYCEKPPASDLAGAEKVAAAADSAKGIFMYGFNQRFEPWAQYVKKKIEEGEMGEIYHAQTQWHRRFWRQAFGSWFADKQISGGGPLLDIGIHRLDQALWLMGFPKILSVNGTTYDRLARAESKRIDKAYSVEDFSAALIRLEGGASVILQTSFLSYLPLDDSEMSTLLMGTECGYLESAGILRRLSNRGPEPSDTVINQFDAPSVTPMGSFIDCVLNGTPPLCTAAQGLFVMQVLDAIYRSGSTGHEIVL